MKEAGVLMNSSKLQHTKRANMNVFARSLLNGCFLILLKPQDSFYHFTDTMMVKFAGTCQ
jgi:hypothetical protein